MHWTKNVRVVLTMTAVAVLATGATHRASAATMTWATVADETGRPSDVLTGGTLFAAVTAGKSTTVNGVKFVGQTPSKIVGEIVFGSAPITVEAVQTSYDSYGSAPVKWDPGYRALVAGGAYSEFPSSLMKIQISGLTAGHKYVVEIFEAFWNTNFATVFVDGASQSSAVNLSGSAGQGSAASSTAQYVTGTFVADSDSESIALTSTTGYVIFDAMQVRDMGVPVAGK
jgi:hypothetical protein